MLRHETERDCHQQLDFKQSGTGTEQPVRTRRGDTGGEQQVDYANRVPGTSRQLESAFETKIS
jgi:hypothetical protein